jgi:hypothetical protein
MSFQQLFGSLSKKRPFIYKVGEDYYAIGQGVCSNVITVRDEKINKPIDLPRKYNIYKSALLNDVLTQQDAWRAYHSLYCSAMNVKDRIGNKKITEKDFENMFSPVEKENIKLQLDEWVNFFQKYNLKEYFVF